YGGEAMAPVAITQNIYEVSEQIRRLKRSLDQQGAKYTDLPDDDRFARSDNTSTGQDQTLTRFTKTEADHSWDAVLARSIVQFDRFAQTAKGPPARPGLYIQDVYVQREAAASLDAFMASDAVAALLIGDSGVGKTNLLCHWAGEQLAAQHAV